ncbi:MAG: two-component system response regulator [Alteromonas sp.]|nr:two-component system response regulator [Alteromonas sp.]
MKPLSILIADDSKLARRWIKLALPENIKYTVVEASNGEEGLQVIRHTHIDLLLLDLNMPVLGGIDVLNILQNNNEKPFVTVISADFQPVQQAIVKQLGAHLFLKKPVNPDRLAMLVEERYAFINNVALPNQPKARAS